MEELIEECIEMQKAELIEDGEVDIDMESVRLAVYENLRDLLRDVIKVISIEITVHEIQ